MNGLIFYEGPSQLTGHPIVGIVTGLGKLGSQNPKTGDMAQAWILRSDMDPSDAIESGGDQAICGNCEHRSADGNIGRSCYVIWWLGPTQVFKAYKAGNYSGGWIDVVDRQLLARAVLGHYVRLGAYGDPAAIPYRCWLPVVRNASAAIGYTQQWRTCDPMFARICMASVQSREEQRQAKRLGWRTFRVRASAGEPVLDNEIVCPASHERSHASTCRECLLCQGTVRPHAPDVVIIAHGQRVRFFKHPEEVGRRAPHLPMVSR